ncbi:MAG: DedA family protein [Patescibacteria group bacterium]|nr:DedA family protein [Patescibacteria group bacterium]MDE1944567.1 DedA family protein [Patescibacteria group bacterium]MDE1945529.1 DedA family protein [Patescibacteria group bacterium]MDE2057826.1 DedA family protein [Patescibacteria group bacterium]
MLTHLVDLVVTGSLTHLWLVPLGIIVGTFILEDATTMLVGVLAADGDIAIPLALLSLYAGIILGDFWLYAMGYLAAGHKWAKWFVNHERYEPVRSWLEERMESAVFTSRFVPGLRLPTYTAAGFLKLPFRRFAVPVVVGTLIWTSLFFGAAYLFGNLTTSWLGPWRWPIGIAFVLGWLFFNQWRIRRDARKREAARRSETITVVPNHADTTQERPDIS